jgi:hypothetical protein
VIFFSACSSVTITPKSFTPRVAGNDKAQVYIYRPARMANAAYSPGVYVDGEFRLFISNATNTLLTITPGEHLLEIAPDKNYVGTTRYRLYMHAAETYYLRVDSALKLVDSAQYEPYQRSFSLTEVATSAAIPEITNCCNGEPQIEKNTAEINPGDTEPTTGFSINKTQNPFSH